MFKKGDIRKCEKYRVKQINKPNNPGSQKIFSNQQLWRRGCRARQQHTSLILTEDHKSENGLLSVGCRGTGWREMQRGRRRRKNKRDWTVTWRTLGRERERERGYCLFSCSSHLRHCGDAESAQLAPNTFETSQSQNLIRLALRCNRTRADPKNASVPPMDAALAQAAQRSGPWAGTGRTYREVFCSVVYIGSSSRVWFKTSWN